MARSPRTTAFQKRQAAKAQALQGKAEKRLVPAFARGMSDYFSGLSGRVESVLETNVKADPAYNLFSTLSGDGFWSNEEDILKKVVTKNVVKAGMAGVAASAVLMGTAVVFDLPNPVAKEMTWRIGRQITGINDETRKRVQNTIKQGINDGLHPSVIGKNLRDQAMGWAGLENLTASRAYTIARTETAHAYNWGAILEYKRSGIVDKVVVHDASDCGWIGHNGSELANGTHRTLTEAGAHPTSHPNCVRAFSPAFGEEAPGVRQRQPVAPKTPGAPSSPQPALPPGVQEHSARRANEQATSSDLRLSGGRNVGGMGDHWERMARARGVTPDALREEARKLMQAELSGRTLATNRSMTSAQDIITRGRFRTQFETQKSGGILDPKWRAKRENDMFGYPASLDPTQRPIYGAFKKPSSAGDYDATSGYGRVQFDLSDKARARSTAIWDDSLASQAIPTSALDIKPGSLRVSESTSDAAKMVPLDRPYLEAQIHGGLTMDDVVRVDFGGSQPPPFVVTKLREIGFRETSSLAGRSGPVWER